MVKLIFQPLKKLHGHREMPVLTPLPHCESLANTRMPASSLAYTSRVPFIFIKYIKNVNSVVLCTGT